MTKVELTLPRRRRKFIKVEAVAELKAGREEGGGQEQPRREIHKARESGRAGERIDDYRNARIRDTPENGYG